MKKFVCLLLLIILCASCITFSACDSDRIMSVKKTDVAFTNFSALGSDFGKCEDRECYVFDYCYDLDTAYIKIEYREPKEDGYSIYESGSYHSFWSGSVSKKDSFRDPKTGKTSTRPTRLIFELDDLDYEVESFRIQIYAYKGDSTPLNTQTHYIIKPHNKMPEPITAYHR